MNPIVIKIVKGVVQVAAVVTPFLADRFAKTDLDEVINKKVTEAVAKALEKK